MFYYQLLIINGIFSTFQQSEKSKYVYNCHTFNHVSIESVVFPDNYEPRIVVVSESFFLTKIHIKRYGLLRDVINTSVRYMCYRTTFYIKRINKISLKFCERSSPVALILLNFILICPFQSFLNQQLKTCIYSHYQTRVLGFLEHP